MATHKRNDSRAGLEFVLGARLAFGFAGCLRGVSHLCSLDLQRQSMNAIRNVERLDLRGGGEGLMGVTESGTRVH
jgi:hypothetical protein